jgi:alpha-tubulin suppressor-like RCC1 family protein
VAAGAKHSLALTSTGVLYAWGYNYYGQIGNGNNTDQKLPVQVMTGVAQIAAGDNHSVALKTDGTVYVWGANNEGQLADGGTTNRNTPYQVTGLGLVNAISGGGNHTLVVLAAGGSMKSWGKNTNGQLGDGTTYARATSPVAVSTVINATNGSGGYAFSFARLYDGTLYSWGNNSNGQLGFGDTTQRPTPTLLTTLTSVAAVATGGYHTLALLSDGSVSAWGWNGYGGVGDGSGTQRTSPVAVSGLASVTAVAAGQYHSVAVTSTGEVWSWGYNNAAQLGDGTTLNRLAPVQIAEAGFNWKAATPTLSVASGTYTTNQTVTITCATSGATIRYTTDGTDPTGSSTAYSSGLSIQESTTLKARAFKSGLAASNVVTGIYTLKVVTPTASPGSGTYTTPQTVTVTTTTTGAALRYTTDGSDPIPSSGQYTGPLSVATTITLKASGFKAGWTTSDVRTATYTMDFGTLAAPTFSPTAGSYVDSVDVVMTAPEGATIRYTTNGSTPTTNSTLYTGPVNLSQTTTLKAEAWKVDYTESTVTSGTYTVKVGAPLLSLASGTYPAGTTVTITATTAGAGLHYTLDGSDPTESDPEVASGGSLVVGNYTLKVRAFRAGCDPSDVATGAYVVTGQLSGGALAAGDAFALLLRPDGTVLAWGFNNVGQLGDGTTIEGHGPAAVAGLTGVVSIAAGASHALAVTGAGDVWSWGYNNAGQLGDATQTNRTTPLRVGGLSNVVAVAAGGSSSAAVKGDGTLWLWGENSDGQLGTGDTADRLTPVQVMTDVAEVALGGRHSIARKEDGSVWAWGYNYYGQLGDGTTTNRLIPVSVSGLGSIVRLEAGDAHSLALGANGWVWAWGYNGYGQLGDGTTTNRPTPVRIPGVLANGIAAGASHSLLTKPDGAVWAWGRNDSGQLGDGTGVGHSAPVPVTGLADIVAVAAGANSSFAISANEAVWSWGQNNHSQLGDGTTLDRLSPVNVALAGYRWRMASPEFDHLPGVYSAEFNLAISTATPGGVIHFTIDGQDPTTSSALYVALVPITQSTVVKARTMGGDGTDSNVGAASYTLKAVPPSFAPTGGVYTSPQTVVISTSTLNSTIRYTTDGQLPTETSTPYAGPLAIGSQTLVCAKVFRNGWAASYPRDASYTFNLGTLAPPVFSPAGGTYPPPLEVVITADPQATIHYTIDGTDPTSSSPAYSSPAVLTANTTIKAKAFNPDWTASGVTSATYSIKLASPSFDIPAGAYPVGQPLTLSAPDASVLIRYTLDGTEPTSASLGVPVGTALNLMGNVTLKAAAYKPNCVPSDTTVAAYTVSGGLPETGAAGGDAHSLAVTTDGLFWAWGSNSYGQLGDGTGAERLVPSLVSWSGGVVRLAAGASHSLATDSGGLLKAWGYNGYGQLGDGTTTGRTAPITVTAFPPGNVVGVAAGQNHSLAARSDGTVAAWGWNSNGQLGDGTTTSRTSPGPVSGLANVARVAARNTHSYAMKTDGTVVAWGSNAYGQLGDGTKTQRTTPVAVGGLTGVIAIAAGAGHGLALTSSGVVWAWGWNGYGQLGDGTTTERLTPVQVNGLTGLVAIAAGSWHSLALRSDGTVWSWGYNSDGQLGDGTTSVHVAPVLVSDVRRAIAIGAGATHSLAVTSDGVVWTWGANSGGQLGDGTKQARTLPMPLSQGGGAWKVGTPTLSFVSGTYASELDVTVSCATPGATIHYTLTGVDPTPTDATVASGSVVHVAETLTLKVRAFKDGQPPSDITTGTYVLALGLPSVSPNTGTYGAELDVTITATPGSTIRYTTDGTEPTEVSPVYVSSIRAAQALTIEAKAWRSGWTASAVSERIYTLKVVAPALAPNGGAFAEATGVAVTTTTPNAVVHYTLDGRDPTLDDPIVSGTVSVDQSTTLRAKGWRAGWLTSDTSGASFNLTLGSAEAPTFEPPGGTYIEPQLVQISTTTPAAVIRYTLDGREPTGDSPIYRRPVSLEETATIKAKAWAEDRSDSTVAVANYTLLLDRALMPRLDPAPGRYPTQREVGVTCPTAGSTVRYTLGGGDPGETDPAVACDGTITVSRSMMVKVRAWKTALQPSAVRVGEYEITGMLAAGGFHTLALDSGGRVWAWGYNGYGELGDGTTTSRSAPYQLAAFSGGAGQGGRCGQVP